MRRSSRCDLDLDKFDWRRADATTDAEIAAQIASDPDTAHEFVDRAEGFIAWNVPVPDVRAIRKKLNLSQAEFAAAYGFSKRTLQDWEQGRHVPDVHTRVFLRVIERHPRVVRDVASDMTSEAPTDGAYAARGDVDHEALAECGERRFDLLQLRGVAEIEHSVGLRHVNISRRASAPPRTPRDCTVERHLRSI